MSRPLVISVSLVVLLACGVAATLAVADQRAADKLAKGTSVAGIDVGGLTRAGALQRLRRVVGAQIGRPVHVRIDGRAFTLPSARAGVRVDLSGAVERAYAASRGGNPLTRGWRALTGGTVASHEDVPVVASRAKVRSFVGSIHSAVARKPVDASVELTITHVAVTPSRAGRRLAGREDLVTRITAALRNRAGTREFRARIATVAPKLGTDHVFDAQPVAVTVSRDDRRVRVFRRGQLERSYTVAVGDAKYATPTGRFVVQSMQKNPTWNVPKSDWAGELAGQTIPGGDPRNPLVARWIGFNGSVGFHGTKSLYSLGRAASHGCVRMNPKDVSDLYERVRAGTPVLVA